MSVMPTFPSEFRFYLNVPLRLTASITKIKKKKKKKYLVLKVFDKHNCKMLTL